MEQQYKTDAEIYAVLEREIIDLTIRPGSSLSENPLCARFGAPRSLIRVVLQKLQENGLVRIVPYKGTTVTRLNRRIVDELIYERTAVEGRILRDFAPNATPAQRAQIRARVDAYEALARAENPDFNKLYEMDCRLHETWFAAMDKMYLWSTLQNAHADYSRFRMLDTMTTGGLDEVIADHRNLLNAIERCDLAAFEPLVERHLYGGIRRLGSKLTKEYADFFETAPAPAAPGRGQRPFPPCRTWQFSCCSSPARGWRTWQYPPCCGTPAARWYRSFYDTPSPRKGYRPVPPGQDRRRARPAQGCGASWP